MRSGKLIRVWIYECTLALSACIGPSEQSLTTLEQLTAVQLQLLSEPN